MQKINYSLEDLDKFNIHKIREIARDVGVKSPASQSKNDLILKIKKVVTGESQPYFNRSKVGRPPKTGGNFDVYNCLFPSVNQDKEYSYLNSASFSLENFIMSVENPGAEYHTGPDSFVEGYIDIAPAGFGVVRTIGKLPDDNEDVLVASILIRQHKLITGDFVQGRCSKIKADKPSVMYRIDNVDAATFKHRKVFEDCPYLPIEKFEVECSLPSKVKNVFGDLYLGGSYFFHSDNMLNLSSMFAQCFAEKGFVTAYLACNTKNTDIMPIAENLETLFLPYNYLDKDKVSMSRIFFQKYKRVAEAGKNVVFIFSGFSNMFRSIDLIYKSKIDETIVIEAVNQVKRIISNAKKIANNASLTIVICDELKVPQVYKEVMLYDIIPNIDFSDGQ